MAAMDTATATAPGPLPALFLSHGSPMIALEDTPAARFLDRLGPVLEATFGRPKAVLVVSPHTATREPVALAAARHGAVHDFGGFPPALYELSYDVDGAPALAQRVKALAAAAGQTVHLLPEGGLDHGIWTPLIRMWPRAGIPVLPLSLVPTWSPARLQALGAALAPLAEEGVLLIGSGSMTHNLRRYFSQGRLPSAAPTAPDVAAFTGWVAERAAARDWTALQDYRAAAPHAALQHPTDEHWLPFYVAAGAGGETATPARLHDSVDGGMLAMDAYAFGPQARRLADALA
jgi:4,5-DOPA dioxygenase extradiol